MAGIFVGQKIWRLDLGKGEPLAVFRFANCSFAVLSNLFAGRAYLVPTNRKFTPLRQLVFTLGGPLANLAAATILFHYAALTWDWPTRAHPFLPILVLTNLWLGVVNLIPLEPLTADSLPTDGKQVANLLGRTSNLNFSADNIRYGALTAASRLKDWPAISYLLTVMDRPCINYELSLALHQRRWADAVQLLEQVADAPPMPDEYYKDALAWTLLCEGRQMERAESLVREALTVAPAYGSFRGTLACIQIRTGRESEGAQTLRELLADCSLNTAAALTPFLARVDPEWRPMAQMLAHDSPYLEFADV